MLPGPAPEDRTWAPFAGSGGDRDQWVPSAVQAVSRLAVSPVPACRSATVPAPLVPEPAVSLRTLTGSPASRPVSDGPVAC